MRDSDEVALPAEGCAVLLGRRLGLVRASTPWCGYCVRLKGQLSREGVPFEVVDIAEDTDAAEIVMGINGGNATVPTLVYSDGSAQTNPPLKAVLSKLDELADCA